MAGNCSKIAVSIIRHIWILHNNSTKLQGYSDTITWLPFIPKFLYHSMVSSFANVINVVQISVQKYGF